MTFPENLVKTAKCHRNMSKRPPIVPVSILGSESHLLNFSDFHSSEPSLTRNYWAILSLVQVLLSKRRSVARVYTHVMFAKGSHNTPTCPAASCFWDTLLIVLSASSLLTFSTDLFLSGLLLIMTETVFGDGLVMRHEGGLRNGQ